MCEYCDENAKRFNGADYSISYGGDFYISKFNNNHMIRYTNECRVFENEVYIDELCIINYCPMCGRKL